MTLEYCKHPDHVDPKSKSSPWNCTVHWKRPWEKPVEKPRMRWSYERNEWVEVKP